MKKIFLVTLVLLWVSSLKSQNNQSAYFAAINTITSSDLKKMLFALASPEMEGRGANSKGIEKSADYIINQFQNDQIGYLQKLNGYKQLIIFPFIKFNPPTLKFDSIEYKELKDYVGYPYTFVSNKSFEIVMLLDKDLDSIQNIDLQGKTVLIFTKNIFFKKRLLYEQLIKKGCRGVMLCNPFGEKEFKGLCKINSEVDRIKKDKLKKSFSGSVHKTDSLFKSLTTKNYYISTIVINPKIAPQILGVDSKTFQNKNELGKIITMFPKTSKVGISVKSNIKKDTCISNNIIGYIEGGELKDQFVVISAHYDHLGVDLGNIFRGADDNASGTATILEIAKAYSIAVKNGFKPKRSIVFAAFTAEEEGLWGSRAFVKESDSLNIKTIVNLNADMVGRGEDSLVLKENPIKKVYIIGSKKDSLLYKKIKSIPLGKDSLKLDFSLIQNSAHLYSSDQANFMIKGIPAAMFFRGLHPDYHTVRDTPEKLDYETMEKIARLIFSVSWKYANNE